MVSEFIGIPGTGTDTFDVLHEIYESDCEAIQIAQAKVLMEHAYRISGDSDILMEGFADICHSIADWFKKLANAIKEFFLKFIKIFTDFSLSLKDYVTKNKDALLATKINTTVNGYEFSVLDSPDPDMSEFDKLLASYNDMLGRIDSLETSEIRKQSSDFLATLNMDHLRGKVLGSKNAIQSDKFLDEVRKFYRSGQESTSSIKVDASYIREIVSHADSLVNAKEKAIKDRDRILKLLKAAESFFNSRVTVGYTGNTPNIKTRTVSSNSSSDKFQSDEGETLNHAQYYKKYSTLMTSKYNEIRELAKIINTVVTERANAFRDQVKQERKLVAMAMKPIVSKSAEESTFYEEDVEEATNYEMVGNEFDFLNEPIVEQVKLDNLCREAIWYHNAMNGQYDYVAMEGVISTLANALQGFVLKITGMFRGKAKEMSKKYTPWLKDDGVIDAIKTNARSTSLNLIDHWSADYRRDLTLIEDAFNRVFQEPNDDKKCEFAANFIKETNIENIKKFKDNNRDMTNVMRNYFRCGKAGVDKMEKVTLAGSALEKQIERMIAYVNDYPKFAETLVNLDAKAKNLKVPTTESLSLWFDSYLNIEGCTVAESALGMILPTQPGFDYVLEATPANAPAPAPGGNTQATQAANNAAKNAPDPNAKGNDNKTDNPTQVVNNENDKLKEAGDQGKGKNGEAKNAYYSFTCDFLKKLVSSYCTVCEEREILYINVLKNCAGPEHRPVFRNGEYVKKSIRVKDEGRTVEVETGGKTKTKTTEKKGVISTVKNAVGKALSKNKAVQNSTDLSSVYEKPTIGLDWMD